ncbi:MAG: hypothetical protein LC117_08345 [Bacteroidia bacterium]|nr:hypothetical protein [Bacteroidia bacterium]MCZ2277921.1 hypothetical protein [Bacteroidia bacterium]
MKRIVLVFMVGWLVMACCSCKTNNHSEAQTEVEAVDTSADYDELFSNADTLLLNNEKQVMFFLPDDDEINRMAEQDTVGEIIEVISDFVYYSSMVCDTLGTSGILCAPVTSKVIIAHPAGTDLFIFNRRDSSQYVTGMLIYDGVTSPEVHFGVADYHEWMRIINEKFGLGKN